METEKANDASKYILDISESKKYECEADHKEYTLYRVKRVGGEKGGWISSTMNLANNGKAWVGGESVVCGHARVFDSATVTGNCEISCSAKVGGNAKVEGNCKVTDNACVAWDAKVSGNVAISGSAKVSGTLEGDVNVGHFAEIVGVVKDKVTVKDHAAVYGTVSGKGLVYGGSTIYGEVKDSFIGGSVYVWDTGKVDGNSHIDGSVVVEGAVSESMIGGAVRVGKDASVKKSTIFGASVVFGKVESAKISCASSVYGAVGGGENILGAVHVGYNGDFKGNVDGAVYINSKVENVTVAGNMNATASISGGEAKNCVVDAVVERMSGGNEVTSIHDKMKEAGMTG